MKPQIEIRRHTADQPWTYAQKDLRQREIAAQARDLLPGAILLSEVAPVITMGRRTESSDLLMPREFYAQQGIDVFETDRGGLATYHGPGQWVLFVVDRLESLTGDSRGVRKAVCGLLEIALQVGKFYDLSAEIRSGAETGVWTDHGKFASVGVHIERGVLLHGLAVNGLRTPTSFLGLKPCGLEAPVSYLLERSGGSSGESAWSLLGERLVDAALSQFWQE